MSEEESECTTVRQFMGQEDRLPVHHPIPPQSLNASWFCHIGVKVPRIILVTVLLL